VSLIFRITALSLIIYEGYLLYFLFNLAKIYRNTRFPRGAEWEHEVSEPSPLPQLYANTDSTLHSLGITNFAILQVKSYAVPSPFHIWIYRSEDTKIWVEVVFNLGVPVQVQFASAFPDSAIILTRYPIGEAIITPMYRSSFARHSIENAYQHHLQHIAEWNGQHGDPLAIQALSDITWYENIYRRKYQHKDYERLNRKTLKTLAWGVLLIICNGLGMVALDSENIYTSSLAILVIFLLTFWLLLIPHPLTNPPKAVDDPAIAGN
jgi:hypothetical protein